MPLYRVKIPLNSNLILLILPLAASGIINRYSLNSNLILLIRRWRDEIERRSKALNSNLILLIPSFSSSFTINCLSFKFQSDSINTVEHHREMFSHEIFKFQSDSINTAFSFSSPGCLSSLNSNLILLIPLLKDVKNYLDITL